MKKCKICPRECRVCRTAGEYGFCREGEAAAVSRVSLHMFEEPPVSGERGSGTIFFNGCNLRCVYCQNSEISRGGGFKKEVSVSELAEIILRLEDAGAENINLVTPTHFTLEIAKSLEAVKSRLAIPVIWNSSAYEKSEVLRTLDGLIDVYLPDFKYASGKLSEKYSSAYDYPEVAENAIKEMFLQRGGIEFDGRGMIKSGIIIRHLVLPGHRKDSMAVLDTINSAIPIEEIKLSLMSQYTPEFARDCEFKNLHRRVTSFEYNSVLEYAKEIGFEGYFQQRSSASAEYTPNFSGEDSLAFLL